MSKQVINVGSTVNDGLGDPFRTGWQKANANFTELYDSALIGEASPSQITSSQNDYGPTGFTTKTYWNINSDSSANKITGLNASGLPDHTIRTFYNNGTTIIPFTDRDSGSSEANQILMPKRVHYLHPGGSVSFCLSTTLGKWQLLADPASALWTPDPRAKFVYVSDFLEAYSGNTALNNASGTGTAPSGSTYGIFAQKVLGAWQIATGSTTTGRSGLCLSNTIAITCGLGRFISFNRVGINTLSTSGEEYSLKVGGPFGYTSTPAAEVDGIGWAYERSVDGDFWICNTCNNSNRTKTVSVAATTNYIWLGVITNDDWTAVEYLYGNDGVNWTRAALHTSNIPGTSRSAPLNIANIIKSAGSTSRIVSIDATMNYYQFLRG